MRQTVFGTPLRNLNGIRAGKTDAWPVGLRGGAAHNAKGRCALGEEASIEPGLEFDGEGNGPVRNRISR